MKKDKGAFWAALLSAGNAFKTKKAPNGVDLRSFFGNACAQKKLQINPRGMR